MLRPVTCVTGRDCTRWRKEIQPSAKHRQLLTRRAGPVAVFFFFFGGWGVGGGGRVGGWGGGGEVGW